MIELIIMLGVGIVIGMYTTSQIKCGIRRNIFNNNMKKYDEKEKAKQQKS